MITRRESFSLGGVYVALVGGRAYPFLVALRVIPRVGCHAARHFVPVQETITKKAECTLYKGPVGMVGGTLESKGALSEHGEGSLVGRGWVRWQCAVRRHACAHVVAQGCAVGLTARSHKSRHCLRARHAVDRLTAAMHTASHGASLTVYIQYSIHVPYIRN